MKAVGHTVCAPTNFEKRETIYTLAVPRRARGPCCVPGTPTNLFFLEKKKKKDTTPHKTGRDQGVGVAGRCAPPNVFKLDWGRAPSSVEVRRRFGSSEAIAVSSARTLPRGAQAAVVQFHRLDAVTLESKRTAVNSIVPGLARSGAHSRALAMRG